MTDRFGSKTELHLNRRFLRPWKAMRADRRARGRRGLTLVEMLVAMTVTLIMVAALVQVFEMIGGTVAESRAVLELSGQMRTSLYRLQKDLEGVTVPMRPWPTDGSALGYFEYVEAAGTDADPVPGTTEDTTGDSLLGDIDDVLMFTARSTGEPFTGRVQAALVGGTAGYVIIESEYAEIIWWVLYNDADGDGVRDPGEEARLYRRVLLIRPDLNVGTADILPVTLTAATPIALLNFLNENDLSVRRVSATGTTLRANSLSDLSLRHNRVAHVPFATVSTFPNPLQRTAVPGVLPAWGRLPWHEQVATNDFSGEDVMLSNLLAFDIKAYDPTVPIRTYGGEALLPGDPGYTATTTVVGQGGYVDLGYAAKFGITPTSLSTFSPAPTANSQLAVSAATLYATPVYDTWSFEYEKDGFDQDDGGSGPIDEGTNGVDDDGINGPDDVGERETMPPYPVPLRGIQITLRAYEPDSRQVRQISIVQDFMPD